ncbi:MAG: GIY-YIG nuclease family protein [Candidatus Magasanikbacteria bacterium]|nr:GIY-YIG nuclease family protein [Candidatus Magasanikbacteria bacterium]
MSYLVYILECCDKTLYAGSTTDLPKRVNEHNNTKAGAKYTRGRRPVKVVYTRKYKTLALARQNEAKIKRLSKEEKLKLIALFSLKTS